MPPELIPPELERIAEAMLDVVERATAPLLARMAALEAVVAAQDARTRESVAEAKAAAAGAQAAAQAAGTAIERGLAPALERLAGVDARLETLGQVPESLVAVRERVAGLEARPPVPGPAGAPGKDGLDGLGFDELAADLDVPTKTLTIRMVAGDRVKAWRFVVPIPVYVGVYREGTVYTRGDCVTWGGSTWHCGADTTTDKPGAGVTAWTLAVKCGRDGKDGKPGAVGPTGPRGRDWEQTIDALRSS